MRDAANFLTLSLYIVALTVLLCVPFIQLTFPPLTDYPHGIAAASKVFFVLVIAQYAAGVYLQA
jgi:hypothetical protein